MNKQFKTELKYYNLTAKEFYNNHKLIQDSIKHAREKIKNALN